MCLPSDYAHFPYQMNCALCGGPGELVDVPKPHKSQGMCLKCGARSSPSNSNSTDAAKRWNVDQKQINDWKHDAELLTSTRDALAQSQSDLAQALLTLQTCALRLRGRPLRVPDPALIADETKMRA